MKCLQKQIVVSMDNRTLRKGKLMLFSRSNYYILISLMSEKGHRENMEVPIPFNIEYHEDEGLMYFDYRVSALRTEILPNFEGKTTSSFFNKILEIQVL
jgi:protein associated with RNAse G/E